jgi:hypothetical protein
MTALAQDYSTLRNKVRWTLLLGQAKIEQEKVRTYWQTGKLIHDHIFHHKDRADYGYRVLENLSKDLDLDESLLDRTLKFYRVFPKIPATWQELTWSHFRTLMTVSDPVKQRELAKLAVENELGARDLEIKIRNLNWTKRIESNGEEIPKLAVPELGRFWTYKIIRPQLVHSKSKVLLLDLGFQSTIELDLFPNHAKFKDGDIVRSVKSKSGTYSLTNVGAQFIAPKDKGVMNHAPTNAVLYTYQCFVERVIDGDTLKVEIDLGFKHRFRLTLRLRGIDAFEMDTAAGKRAKAFVERALHRAPFVTIKSTRDDKYGRYLADVFYDEAASIRGSGLPSLRGRRSRTKSLDFARDPEPVEGQSTYLNQYLLDERLAVKV